MPKPHPGHHPEDDQLADYAAGDMAEAPALLVATHLALCPACRRQVADYEALGGELLGALPEESVGAASLERVLARLDDIAPAPAAREALPEGGSHRLPQPLRDYMSRAGQQKKSWRSLMPGLRTLRLDAAGAKTWMMELAPGRAIPQHGHRGREMVLVLSGGYHDGPAGYGPGDVQMSGPDSVHEPVADADGPCLCLVVSDGGFHPTSLLGRLVVALLGY
jgi:putative transcriptional regulator